MYVVLMNATVQRRRVNVTVANNTYCRALCTEDKSGNIQASDGPIEFMNSDQDSRHMEKKS